MEMLGPEGAAVNPQVRRICQRDTF